jgi:hypothetical protein
MYCYDVDAFSLIEESVHICQELYTSNHAETANKIMTLANLHYCKQNYQIHIINLKYLLNVR